MKDLRPFDLFVLFLFALVGGFGLGFGFRVDGPTRDGEKPPARCRCHERDRDERDKPREKDRGRDGDTGAVAPPVIKAK